MSATSRMGLKQDYGRRRQSTPDWLPRGNRSWRQPGSPGGRHPRIVALGGGTGLPILLRGLKATLFPPPWTWVPERDRALGCRLLERDLLAAGPMIRHDPDKLARAVLDLHAEAWT
jgi:hypothetical protein